MSTTSKFSREELTRYSRHITLDGVGLAGQEKLKQAAVLVAGAGGLGSPVIQYLASTGIGKIGIIDNDIVDLTNLQRQVLFKLEDIGKPKAWIAAEWVKKINPNTNVNYYQETVGEDNIHSICRDYSIICDCTDNFKARYIINDAAYSQKKPYIYGSILGFEGQVGVFNRTKKSPSYRDLVPSPPPPGLMPSCVENGVLGVLPGIIGTLQATEIIKIAIDKGEILDGKILIYNALKMSFRTLQVAKTGDNIKDKEERSTENKKRNNEKKIISAVNLKKMLETKEEVLLIDVRKPEERNICVINSSKNYTSETILNRKEVREEIRREGAGKKIVLYCKSGFRSEKCLEKLIEDSENIFSLEGGIIKWIEDVDGNLARY